MKRILLFCLVIVNLGIADEVLLKNGQLWKNVNIIEEASTQKTITIFTSKSKKIIIDREDIGHIKMTEFNPRKKSELITLSKNEIKTYLDNEETMAIEDSVQTEKYTRYAESVYETDTLLSALPEFRIDAGIGFSYRTVDVPSNAPQEIRDYLRELKSGSNIDINLAYYFIPHFGITLNYSRFSSSNNIDNIEMEDLDTGHLYNSYGEDNISISYIGVGLTNRSVLKASTVIFYFTGGFGYMYYNNDAKIKVYDLNFTQYMDIEGETFAAYIAVSMDFMLTEKFGLGGKISLVGGSIDKYKVNGNEINLDEGENMGRFDFNIGLRYYF